MCAPIMDVVLVTAEVAPFSGRAASAEWVSALAKALRGREHRVTVVSPLYRSIDPAAKALARRLTGARVELGGETWDLELYDGRTAGGVSLLFLGQSDVFGDVDALDEGAPGDVARRGALLGHGAVAALGQLGTPTTVLHGHGWAGGLALAAAAASGLEARRVLSLDDPDDAGRFAGEVDLGLDGDHAEATRRGGATWALGAGIRAADAVVAGAPAHARSLVGEGAPDPDLAAALAPLGDRLLGIAPGVDASIWNPATDARLPARFDPMDRRGKDRTRAGLQNQLGLPLRADVPLFGVLARPGAVEGFDLLQAALPDALSNDVQFAIEVSDPSDDGRALADALEDVAARWPERVQVRRDGDELAHRIVAGADFLVLPARRDPYGTWARVAHRYGTLPVAHRTGGLEDAVVDCDPSLRTGNGLLFDAPTSESLLAALRRGAAARTDADAFEALQARVMRVDHSWDRTAVGFERVYRHPE